jgi:MobA/MobL family
MSAALYHLHASIGSRAKGASAGTRYEYLEREGIFAEPGRCAEDFVATLSGNMPAWADADAGLYWRMADLHERDKAVLYREVEFAISHGIPQGERLEWADKMARAVATTKDGRHPYTLALHAGKDGANWNAHVIVSERVNDGIGRDPEKWFSRAAVASRKTGALDPAKGGARKTREMQPTKWLLAQRKNWETIGNQALAKAGREERLDCRSYKERGIEKLPQIHLGRKAHQMMQRGAASDRVATYQEIAKANELLAQERSSAAELARTTARIEAAVADRKSTAAEVARAAEIEKLATPAVPARHPVETELVNFLKQKSVDDAHRYLKDALPFLARQKDTTAWERHCANTADGYGRLLEGPGKDLEKERERYEKLIKQRDGDPSKRVGSPRIGLKQMLDNALKANRGIFGQKKDTPEITAMKDDLEQLETRIRTSDNNKLIYEARWEKAKPACQKEADRMNALYAQARKFLPFVEAGKSYVHERAREQHQAKKQEKQQEQLTWHIGRAEKSGYQWARQNVFPNSAYWHPEEAKQELESCTFMYALKGTAPEQVRRAFYNGAAYAVIEKGLQDGYSTQMIAQAVRQSTGIAGKRFNDLMSEPEPSRFYGKTEHEQPRQTKTIGGHER